MWFFKHLYKCKGHALNPRNFCDVPWCAQARAKMDQPTGEPGQFVNLPMAVTRGRAGETPQLKGHYFWNHVRWEASRSCDFQRLQHVNDVGVVMCGPFQDRAGLAMIFCQLYSAPAAKRCQPLLYQPRTSKQRPSTWLLRRDSWKLWRFSAGREQMSTRLPPVPVPLHCTWPAWMDIWRWFKAFASPGQIWIKKFSETDRHRCSLLQRMVTWT